VILVAKYDSKGFVVKLKLTLYEITKWAGLQKMMLF
jgi:hypothetical protein